MAAVRQNKNPYGKNVYRSMAMITQFGINMLVPIVLCSLAGMYLDRKLGTSFLMIVLFFVGALAGFRNIYIFSKRIYEQPAQSRRKRKQDGSSDDKKTQGFK
jgi:F0F1-type ATP synthase assembly protein I